MLRNTCELATGRLLEIRVGAGYRTVADVEDMIRMITINMAKVPAAEKCAIAADWRAVHLMPPDVAARAREMIAATNPRVIRSSILTLPENPLTNLQAVRLIREAENPNRRHFTSATSMHAWLSEVLTPAESARAKIFLASS
jgi:hypothetical protein